MKKTIIFLLCLACFSFVLFFIFNPVNRANHIYVIHSFSETYDDGYIQNLSVIAPALYASDSTTCAKQILSHCLENDFPNLQFSYDTLGYPSEIHGTVYTTEAAYQKGTPVFSFSYQQTDSSCCKYDVYHHPERFHLYIIEEASHIPRPAI